MSNAKPLQIFRSGRQIASDGQKIDFTDAMLMAVVSGYDPALHEAPAVVGHPKDTAPAYGWAKTLSFKDGVLCADLDQVDPAFAELVNAGRFKKISASFYSPDSPSNPKPGDYYLRHIGFLGAQPPSVKGLKSAEFADGEEGIVEFAASDWTWPMRSIARLMQGVREWIIADKGIDAADKVLPAWDVQAIEDAAVRAETQANPNYSETEDTEKNLETAAQLAARATQLATDEAALALREKNFAEAQKTLRAADDATLIDGLVKAGRLVPVAKKGLLEFMAGLDATGVVEFAEGAEKQTPRDYFRDLLNTSGTVVNFGEVSASEEGEGDALSNDPAERGAQMGQRALDFMESERIAGRRVPTTMEAVAHIKKTTESNQS